MVSIQIRDLKLQCVMAILNAEYKFFVICYEVTFGHQVYFDLIDK